MPLINKVESLPVDGDFDIHKDVKEHRFGLFEMKGERPSQEDAAFACWYTSEHFNSLSPQEIGRRLWTSYHKINDLGRDEIWGGSTATTTVYDGRGNLITANLADSVSFAVVYDTNDALAGVVRLNSHTHNPCDERERIKRVGGMVLRGRIDGELAVSRALGDFAYNPEVVCADSCIDIHRLTDIYASLGIKPESVKKVQIIATCDGFTEPLRLKQSKLDHELWLKACLGEIDLISSQEEHELAKKLAYAAYFSHSEDNISIAVQTLDESMPFLMGIYDGHGGFGTSMYAAKNIGIIFDAQCLLSQEDYAQQDLSADKKFLSYYRDNKEDDWYAPLAEALIKTRKKALSKTSGVRDQLTLLKAEGDLLCDSDKDQIKRSAYSVCFVINKLAESYVNLALSDKEFYECATQIIGDKPIFGFKLSKYTFLDITFSEFKKDVIRIKKESGFGDILKNLNLAIRPFRSVESKSSLKHNRNAMFLPEPGKEEGNQSYAATIIDGNASMKQ